jgi:hypothetical protein
VGASTSHNPMGLYGLLQGYLYLLYLLQYLLMYFKNKLKIEGKTVTSHVPQVLTSKLFYILSSNMA